MKLIAIDTETHMIPNMGDKVHADCTPPPLVVVGACFSPCSEFCAFQHWTWEQPEDFLAFLEEHDDATLVFHNARFDLAVLNAWCPVIGRELKQFLYRHAILDTRVLYAGRKVLSGSPRTLKAIYKELCNGDLEKGDVQVSFNRNAPITEEQIDYLKQDCKATYDVAKSLLSIPYGGLIEDNQFDIVTEKCYNGLNIDKLYSSASSWLAFNLETVGLSVDRPVVEELYKEYADREQILCEQLHRKGFADIVKEPKVEPRSEDAGALDRKWTPYQTNPPRLRRIWKGAQQTVSGRFKLNTESLVKLFESTTIAAPRTDTGRLSLEYDFWKEYRDDLPEDAKVYLDLSKVRKFLSAFLTPLYKSRAAHVYPFYTIPGAETFRWACSRPNMQQQPKKLRRMYRSPIAGKQLVGADYTSLEVYTLVHIMNCLGIRGPLAEALKQEDIHSFVADKVGVSRQEAKVCTFGLGGGMAEKRFYQYMRYGCGLQVTFEQAADARQRWLDYFYDVSEYLDRFRQDYFDLCPPGEHPLDWVERLGFEEYETPNSYELSRRMGGRLRCHLPSGRIIPNRTFTAGANAMFQGTGADVMTTAFLDLCVAGIPVAAVVHDSAYVVGEEHAEALETIMQEALLKVCPTLESVPRPKAVISERFF